MNKIKYCPVVSIFNEYSPSLFVNALSIHVSSKELEFILLELISIYSRTLLIFSL